jgi:hypothetical protein
MRNTRNRTALLWVCLAGAACAGKHDGADVDAPTDAAFDAVDALDDATMDDASVDDSGVLPSLDDSGGHDADAAVPEVGADAAVGDAADEAADASDGAAPEGGPSEIIPGTPYDQAMTIANYPASHTHVLFGTETIYLSHLPGWFDPHAWQEVTAIAIDAAARGVYVQDRMSGGTLLYTILPQDFALPSLVAPDAASLVLSADIYRGNLEANGTHIASGSLSAPRVIHFRHLDPATPRPAEPAYLIFGSARETFMVHLFTTEPDFDQILAVQLPPALANDPRLAAGIQLRLPGQNPTVPLDAGATPAVRIADTSDLMTLTVLAEINRDVTDLQ